MGDPVAVTNVQPIFKVETPDKKTELVAEIYLYPIQMGWPRALAAGGAYWIGEDGKPKDPSDKTKPKPIPAARYFFHRADHLLKPKEIAKLSRGDCFAPVTLEPKPGATVILKDPVPLFTFIMGKDDSDTNKFYESAEKHFLWELGYPTAWITKPDRKVKNISLVELLDLIDAITDPIEDVTIVSHANLHGWLGFPLEPGEKTPVGFEPLKKKLDEGGLTDLSAKLTHCVIIRGCNIGQSPDMLDALKQAFGGKTRVVAPTHKQGYKNTWKKEKGKGITKTKSWEFFETYWIQEKGPTKKTDKVLLDDLVARYPETAEKDLKSWVAIKKITKRSLISLSTNSTTMTTHPPEPDKIKETWKFVSKNWKRVFGKDFKPKSYVGHSGPTDGKISYEFEGKFREEDTRRWVEGTITIPVDVHPEDDAVIAEEKPRFPDPDRFEWSVSRTPNKKTGRTLIRAKGIMTLFSVKKPLIDEKKNYIAAKIDDKKYWGSSK